MKLLLILALGLCSRGLSFHSVPLRAYRTKVQLEAVGIFYSTTTGNTENVAGYIQEAMKGSDIVEISEASDETLTQLDGLIVGSPTWHTGADEMRSGTSWDDFLYENLPNIDLSGKKVAIFGVGDQASYADYFCDAAGEIYDCFAKQGADIIGFTSIDGFDNEDSKAIRDGKFCGQMFDEDNQPELSAERAAAWVKQLADEGMPF